MGWLHETAASLRFFGDDLDPKELTALLGCQPSVGARKGETWRTSRGAEKIAHKGTWRLRVERRRPDGLDAQIQELLAPLTDDLTVWRELTSRFQADIFLGLFMASHNDGTSLNSDTTSALGSRGLTLNFDIYAPEEQ